MGGSFDLGDRTIRLADITAPVLVFGGATDGIAPIAAVNAVVPLLTGAAEVRFEIVPGGHLGMLTGRAARTETWPLMDEWIDQWSAGRRRRAGGPDPRAGARTASRDSIGSNPTRRYGSAGVARARAADPYRAVRPVRPRGPRSSSQRRAAVLDARASHASYTVSASSSRVSRPTWAPRSSTEGCPSKCGVVKNGVDSSSTSACFASSDSTQRTMTSS